MSVCVCVCVCVCIPHLCLSKGQRFILILLKLQFTFEWSAQIFISYPDCWSLLVSAGLSWIRLSHAITVWSPTTAATTALSVLRPSNWKGKNWSGSRVYGLRTEDTQHHFGEGESVTTFNSLRVWHGSGSVRPQRHSIQSIQFNSIQLYLYSSIS